MNAGGRGGRPRGLASYAQEQTKDGKSLVDFYVRVFTGKEIVDKKKPTLKERMEAGAWLADRGFGKPVQKLEGEVRVPIAIVHRLPDHDPLAPRAPRADEERALDLTALPVRALKGRTS